MSFSSSRRAALREIFGPILDRIPKLPRWVPITCFILATLMIVVGVVEHFSIAAAEHAGGKVRMNFIQRGLYALGGKWLLTGSFLFAATVLAAFGIYVLLRRRAAAREAAVAAAAAPSASP